MTRRPLGADGHRRHRPDLRPRPAPTSPMPRSSRSGRARRRPPTHSPTSSTSRTGTASYAGAGRRSRGRRRSTSRRRTRATTTPRCSRCAAGKAVLCEKPFAMDLRRVAGDGRGARSSGTLLVEAMWTRFLPTMARVREILAAGTLGVARVPDRRARPVVRRRSGLPAVRAVPRRRRAARPGHLPVSFAHMVLGAPARITAVERPGVHRRGRDDVDDLPVPVRRARRAHHLAGRASNNPAAIYGTEARLELDGWFYTPTGFRVVSRDGEVLEPYTPPAGGRGMEYEATEVGRCLRDGLTESPLMPLDETLAVMAPGRDPPPDRPRLLQPSNLPLGPPCGGDTAARVARSAPKVARARIGGVAGGPR